jgi:hypothetical protein
MLVQPRIIRQTSSPGLTGRSSIPEPPAIESRGRGVLDRPVKPGDDKSWEFTAR